MICWQLLSISFSLAFHRQRDARRLMNSANSRRSLAGQITSDYLKIRAQLSPLSLVGQLHSFSPSFSRTHPNAIAIIARRERAR